MLSISFKDTPMEFNWHVGEKLNSNQMKNLFKHEFDNIQLDGDELEKAKTLFPNTIANRRVVRIYGEEAKTIAWNLVI